MKKLFYLLLVVGLGVTVAACGNSTTTTTTTTKPTTQQTTTKPTTTENKDKISPVIDLKTTTAEVMKGEQLFDARANISDAFDNADSNVSPDNVQIDMGGYEGIDSEVGTYTITYSIADNAGNTTIATCTVTVVEVEPSILFTGADGLEYSWPMNYNPVLGAQYTQGYGLDQWAYELTKVTVLSKDYFEWLNDNMYERISASWSFVMVADSDLKIVYVRDHMSNEFYTEEGVVVNKVSTDWCTGTPTGGNDQYCGVTQGRQTANLVDKIPDGGYVIVFINDGVNSADSPRGFGQKLYDIDPTTGGIGQQVSLIGTKEFGSTNAPAYVKTTETHIDAYYGSELNLLDGISYVSYNNTADLDIEVEVYPIVGGLADLANPADAIDTTAPQAGADGLVPETSYVVKYTIEENGRTDFLIRSYTLKEDSSTVSAYQQRFTLGEKSTLVYLNDADALVAHDSGLGMVINTNDRPHLMDIPTVLAQLQAQKDAGVEKVTYQYGAYYVLDKDLKVIQIVFAIGLDVSMVKDAEGNWTPTNLDTGSKHNLLNDFLGETQLVDLSKAAFVLFTQNTAANNATVRQFGVDLWNTDGQFKVNGVADIASFNQQVLLENAAVIAQEGTNSAGKVLETKTYTVTSALADASGKVYETSFNHGWYWSGDNAEHTSNTWLRFSGNMLHVIDKEFAGTLESLYSYVPWASAVILDKDLKVVAIRSFYEEMVDGTQHKALKYVSKNEAGEFVVLDAQNNEDGNWNGYNNYDAVSKIAEYIPEGGYAFPLITSATITNPLLKAILDDVENPTAINDYQFTWVYQLAIAE